MKLFFASIVFLMAFCWQSTTAQAQIDSLCQTVTTHYQTFNDPGATGTFELDFHSYEENPINANVSWLWDFGDGNTSIEGASVTHGYVTAGTYNVTLTTTSISGCTSTTTFTVEVVDYDVCSIGFYNYANVDLINTFVLYTYYNAFEGTVVWDFGDGSATSIGANISHVFPAEGTYTVTVIYTSPTLGCADTVSQVIEVIDQPDYCYASFGNYYNFENFLVQEFYDMSISSDLITSFFWDFGDGNTSTEQFPSYQFSTGGTFPVSLTIGTAGGCTSTTTQGIFIDPAYVTYSCETYFTTAQIASNSVSEVIFQAVSTYGWQLSGEYVWDFGDGTTGTGAVVNHIYDEPGDYTVTITNEDAGCEFVSYSQVVNVAPPLNPCATTFYAYSNLPYDVAYSFYGYQTDYSVTLTSWTWNFGDGTTTTVTDPNIPVNHVYATSGNYTVTLTTEGTGGCSYTSSQEIEVLGADSCYTNAYYYQGFGGQVNFSESTFPASPLDNTNLYLWNFGDGNTSTEQTPIHTYENVGEYIATLTVTTATGCVVSTTFSVWLSEYYMSECYASFIYIQINTADSLAVTFQDYSYGLLPATAWSWSFGDGASSNEQNPTHTYPAAGVYEVTLTSSNDGCEAIYVYTLYVDPSYVVDICAGNSFYYYQTGYTYDSTNVYFYGYPNYYSYYFDPTIDWTTEFDMTWDFGDGTTGTGAYLTHQYPATGDYNVILYMSNATTGCFDTIYQTVSVGAGGYFMEGCYASFYFNQDIDNPNLLTFTNASYGDVVSATWDFGDGSDPVTSFAPTHEFTEEGSYEITLDIVTADGCNSTVSSYIWIGTNFWYPTGCQASFSANIIGTSVMFMDMSTALTGVESWSWDFGDGNTSNEPSPMHTYDSLAVYSVVLTITTDGCTSSYQMNVDLVNGLTEEGNMFFFLVSGSEDATLNSLNVALAPNPTTGNTSLKFETTESFDYQLDVVDLSGRILSSIEKSATRGKNTVEIDANTLQTGMYMVRLRSGEATKTIRFVKI
jgi:PKD repeat protein